MVEKKRFINLELFSRFVIFVLLLVSYSYVFPRWADPNQNSRLDMVVAVVDDGTFRINRYVENTVDYAKVGEHYYSDKAPGIAFLGIPLYAGLRVLYELPLIDGVVERLSNSEAFRATLREGGSGIYQQKVQFAITQVALSFLLAVVPSAILGVLIYIVLGKFSLVGAARIFPTLAYGLLTPAFAYAGALYGHQLSAALLFAAFCLIFTRASVSGLESLVIGFLLGYSVITEYPAALIAGILFLYLTYRLYLVKGLGKLFPAVASGAVVIGLWMVYNTAVFGGPLNLGYGYSELWTQEHQTGFMSLTSPRWDALWGITFSGFRGLFVLSPILLVALPGFILWWQSKTFRAEGLVAAGSVAVMFLFNSSSVMWWGGFAVGPRYLLPALPFMALPLGFAIQRWGSQVWFKITTVLLSAGSLMMTWGLTLAGQAFSPDTIKAPLPNYALPNWLEGNIARNLGTILGLKGVTSLLPLVVFVAFALLLLSFVATRASRNEFSRKSEAARIVTT